MEGANRGSPATKWKKTTAAALHPNGRKQPRQPCNKMEENNRVSPPLLKGVGGMNIRRGWGYEYQAGPEVTVIKSVRVVWARV